MRVAAALLLLLLLVVPVASAAPEGVVVPLAQGDEVSWEGEGERWLVFRAGPDGARATGSPRPLSTPVPAAPEGGGEVAEPGAMMPHGGFGTRVDLTEGASVLRVEEGSGRALLGRVDLLSGAGNGTVGVLEARALVAPGECAAWPFGFSVFGSLRGGAVPSGDARLEMGGPGLRLALVDDDLETTLAEADDVLSLPLPEKGFDPRFVLVPQACAPMDAEAPREVVVRVTRWAPPEQEALRATPAPLPLAAALVAAALLRRARSAR